MECSHSSLALLPSRLPSNSDLHALFGEGKHKAQARLKEITQPVEHASKTTDQTSTSKFSVQRSGVADSPPQ
jgi:hypothetical protein